MAKAIVDSSVAFKWLNLEEIDSDPALDLLNSHLTRDIQIYVPDLILYELANVWCTKGTLSSSQIKDNLRLFFDYKLTIVPINIELLNNAVELSKETKMTVYDAIYAVLGKQKQCNLITADEKFVKAVNLPFIMLLSDIELIKEGLKDIKAGRIISWKKVKKKAGID